MSTQPTPEEQFEELKKNTTQLSETIQEEMNKILKKVEGVVEKLDKLQKTEEL